MKRDMSINTKTKTDILRLRGKFKPNYNVLYTLVFLFMTAVVFHYFAFSGKTSIWCVDGKVQNYNALVYTGIWLRDLAKNIFVNHSFSIPTYTFRLGYGGDIIQLLHYYALGDPFNLLSAFVPSSKTLILYHILMVLRLYFAGLTFSKMCLYFNKNIDKFALLAGALAYVFGSYALISVTRHPYFINPMIYMPLIILGLEKIRHKESPVIFVLGVFLSVVSQFYFLFQIAILSALYFVGKLIFERKKYTAKENLFYILRLAAYTLLGTAMACTVFLPVIIQTLNDPRMGVSSYLTLFYNYKFYVNFLKNLIASRGTAGHWTNIGMGGIIIPALYTLFSKRGKRTYLKFIVVILILFTIIPFFGHVFNGMSYVSNRWVWAVALALAYVIAVTAEDFALLSPRNLLRCMVVLIVYFAIYFIFTKMFVAAVIIQIIIAVLALIAVSALGNPQKIRRFAGLTVSAAVILGIVFNSYFIFSPNQGTYLNEYCILSGFNKSFNANEANLLSKKYKEDGFYRYSGTSLTDNASLTGAAPSTQFYYSLSNPNLFEWFSELNSNVTIGQSYKDLNDSTFLNTLANVKYFTLGVDIRRNVGGYLKEDAEIESDKRVPYGYDKKNVKHWAFTSKCLKSKKTTAIKGKNVFEVYSVYKNKNFLPFGYTYSGYIPRSEYSKLSPLEKQEALIQGVVTDKEINGLKTITPEISSKKINYKIKTSTGVTQSGNKFITKAENTRLTFELDGGLKNSETYIHFKNIDFKGAKARNTNENNQANTNSDDFEGNSKLRFKLRYGGIKKDFDFRTRRNIYYQGRRDYLINLNYCETPTTQFTMVLPAKGVYSFDSIDIYSLPMDGYESRIEKLRENVLENVDFHNGNNSGSTNEITGNISVKENKLLCLTIPYSSSWTAYVDGKETEILRANTAFSGIILTKGAHKIRLVYNTAGFRVGTVLSIIGFAIFIGLIVFGVIKKKHST